MRAGTARASLCLLAWALACGEEGGGAHDAGEARDGASDSGALRCDTTFTLEPGNRTGHLDPFRSGAAEARAGRLGEGVWPNDPEDLSTVRQGDFVLANDRIAVVVEDVGASDGFDPWGGRLVGISRVSGGAPVEPGQLTEVILLLDRFAVATETVGVLADGTDGGPAIVRAVGPLEPLPFLEPIVGTLLPGDLTDFEVAIDFSLAPSAEHVDISLTFASRRASSTAIRSPLVFMFQDDRMPQWVPGLGFGPAGTATPYVAYVDDDATSIAWADPGGDLRPFLELSGASVFQHATLAVPACAESSLPFGRLTLGGPGLDGLAQAIARERGEAQRTIEGIVTEPTGAPAERVRVHAVSSDGHLTRVLTGSDGRYALHVPAAMDVELTAWRRGDEVVGPIDVPATTATADIALAPTGAIHVAASEAASSEPLPVRVQITPMGAVPSVPDVFGEWKIPAGRLHVEYPLDGNVTLRVPPGRHTVTVSRGFEYEIVHADVDVAPGETVDVIAGLARVVDTTGVMCGDFHIHTHRSMDAKDPALLKVASAVADGVEIPVRSDHEWVADFEPQIAALGVEAWAYGVGSLELTTLAWGHFGVFPLDPDDAAPNGGAPVWPGRTPPEVFAELRARSGTYGSPVIIVNHPRRFGGLMNEGAYFDRVGYDPATGMVVHADLWDDQFGLVEVFNDDSFLGSAEEVADWFSFLNAGRRVFAVGSSDSHEIADVPVGYPRTCIELGVDSAAELRALGSGPIRDALVAGHATVSGGIYIDATTPSGAGPGDDVTTGALAELSVIVRAATWIDVDELRVYVDGALAGTLPIDETTTDPLDPTVRFRSNIDVDVAASALGSWVVLAASGDTDLAPIFPGRMPFGVTNPIFLSR